MLKSRFIKKSIVAITSMGFCGSLLFHKPANAQVNVSPLVIFTQTKQGTATGFITLINGGNEAVKMNLYALPFTYNSNGFQVLESSPNDLSPYLIFSPSEIVLEPKQTRRVRLLARLLPSMKSGEYRAVIFSQPFKPKNTSGLTVNNRLGTVVYVSHGEIRESLIPKETNYDIKKEELYLLVKNEGNVTIRSQGRWELKQAGKPGFQGEISKITIIAEGTRNVPITIEKDQTKTLIPAGNYQLTGELFWGDPRNPTKVPFSLPVTIPSR